MINDQITNNKFFSIIGLVLEQFYHFKILSQGGSMVAIKNKNCSISLKPDL